MRLETSLLFGFDSMLYGPSTDTGIKGLSKVRIDTNS